MDAGSSVLPRSEELHRFQWEALLIVLLHLGVMLDPQIEEALKVDERYSTVLLAPYLALCLGGESTSGDEDADILPAEHCHEGPQPINVDLVDSPLHLHLDAWSSGTKGIGIGENVQASVWAGRRNPGDVIAPSLSKVPPPTPEIQKGSSLVSTVRPRAKRFPRLPQGRQ